MSLLRLPYLLLPPEHFEVYFKVVYAGLEIFNVDLGVFHFLSFLCHFNENVHTDTIVVVG